MTDYATATLERRKLRRREAVDLGASLRDRYRAVRKLSLKLCDPLEAEDYVIQSMPDVSPTRWHLAHVTWFFETFVLGKYMPGYRPFHPEYVYLFNSYYNAVGRQFPRPHRGFLSRPTVKEIMEYRAYVDEHMDRLLSERDEPAESELSQVVETGLHHEQQHQELLLTDIKHVFSWNPLFPVYRKAESDGGNGSPTGRKSTDLSWVGFEEGIRSIGHDGQGFSYDNERPRHRKLLEAFELASRLVTNAEYLEFIEDGGYERAEFWLSEGWATVQDEQWEAPLYWIRRDGRWYTFTLSGLLPVDPAEPVCHVSFFEADAYGRWKGARLPLESEWEVASGPIALDGNFVDAARYHPVALSEATDAGPAQMFGDVWEWTSSPYVGYPGYRPPPGAIGEYNGKFMCNQMVLRGGSCATSRSHIRRTYRNFFPPSARWQFSGFRLAR